MRLRLILGAGLFWALTALAPITAGSTGSAFEVWALDQSDTHPQGGGLLYIWEGAEISSNAQSASPELVDLAQAAQRAGCSIGKRPHMVLANHSRPPSHVIISNVASGDIFFMEVASRTLAGCVSGTGNAHSAAATPDNSMVLVDDLAGQMLHKIQTDYASNAYSLVESLSLAPFAADLGTPDARPVCHDYTADSRFAYVTMAGGGLLVVAMGSADGSTAMRVVKVYDQDTVKGIGCGALRLPDQRMLTNGESGAGGGNDFLYLFDTAGTANGIFPDPIEIELPGEDAHGLALCEDPQGKLFALTAMRVSNDIDIVDLQTHQVIQSRSIAQPWSPDPKPDIAGIVGDKVFVSLRGPKPLTAITSLENSERTPGVAVLTVNRQCDSVHWDPKDLASMRDDARTTTLSDGTVVTAADPHGLVVVPR